MSINMKLEIFSNQYYRFLDKFVESDFEDGKVLGKYYTHSKIAEKMIAEILQRYSPHNSNMPIRIIDPFCGDGRLISILLIQMSVLERFKNNDFQITLWDIDKKALASAHNNIEHLAENLGLHVSISSSCSDAFVLYASEEGSYDICVTNPPWGLLKPQKIFNERCDEAELNDYKNAISVYDEYMKSEFPLSQPTKKFGRWGTNLGRTGTEVALRLIGENGLCGLVSPASLLNDQVSAPLREWIFDKHCIYTISYYPAELKLYGKADVSSITTVIGHGKTENAISANIYDTEGNSKTTVLGPDELAYSRDNLYSLPLELGLDIFAVMKHFQNLITVQDFCDKYGLSFTRELDETRVSEKLSSSGNIIFAKGYMVDRFKFQPNGLFLNEEIVSPPPSVFSWKLVWRDVSRNSQKRRMKATLIAPGCIAGNSLGVIYSKNEDIEPLMILLAFMNSMIFEFQARGQLVSNHVAAGIVKQIRVPDVANDKMLVEMVGRMLDGEDLELEIESYVAQVYGLNDMEIRNVFSKFDLSEKDTVTLEALLAQKISRRNSNDL